MTAANLNRKEEDRVVSVLNSLDPNDYGAVFSPPSCKDDGRFVFQTADGAMWRFNCDGSKRYILEKPPRCAPRVDVSGDPNKSSSVFHPRYCQRITKGDNGENVEYENLADGSIYIFDGIRYILVKQGACCPQEPVLFSGGIDPNQLLIQFYPTHCQKNCSMTYYSVDDGSRWAWNAEFNIYVQTQPADCPDTVSVFNSCNPNDSNATFVPKSCFATDKTKYVSVDGSIWKQDPDTGTFILDKAAPCPKIAFVNNHVLDPNESGTTIEPVHCSKNANVQVQTADGALWTWNASKQMYVQTSPPACPIEIKIKNARDPNKPGIIFDPIYCGRQTPPSMYIATDNSRWSFDSKANKYVMTQKTDCPCPISPIDANIKDPNSVVDWESALDPSYCATHPDVVVETVDGAQWKFNEITRRYDRIRPPDCPNVTTVTGSQNDPSSTLAVFSPDYCSKTIGTNFALPDGSVWIWNGTQYIRTKLPDCPVDIVRVVDSKDPNIFGSTFNPSHCGMLPDVQYISLVDNSEWVYNISTKTYSNTKKGDCPPEIIISKSNDPNAMTTVFDPDNCSRKAAPTTYLAMDGSQWKYDPATFSYNQTKPPNCPGNVVLVNGTDPNQITTGFEPTYCAAKPAPTVYVASDDSQWMFNPTTQSYDMTKPPNCPTIVSFSGVNNPNTSGAVFDPLFCAKNATTTFKGTDGSEWKWNPTTQQYDMTLPPPILQTGMANPVRRNTQFSRANNLLLTPQNQTWQWNGHSFALM